MKIIIQILILLLFTASCIKKSISLDITNLKLEQKRTPLGVDISNPRFSWNMESEQRGVKQAAYQILVASSLKKLQGNEGDMWDSQRIIANQSIQIYYKGKPLESNKKYFWKVMIWSQKAQIHQSKIAYWTTGLLNESSRWR